MVVAANAAGTAEATITTRWSARGAIDSETEFGTRRRKVWKAWLSMLINCSLILSYLKVMLHLVAVHLGNGLTVGHVHSSLVKRTTSTWIARPDLWNGSRKLKPADLQLLLLGLQGHFGFRGEHFIMLKSWPPKAKKHNNWVMSPGLLDLSKHSVSKTQLYWTFRPIYIWDNFAFPTEMIFCLTFRSFEITNKVGL